MARRVVHTTNVAIDNKVDAQLMDSRCHEFEATASRLVQESKQVSSQALAKFERYAGDLAGKLQAGSLGGVGATAALRKALIGSADLQHRLLELNACLSARLQQRLREAPGDSALQSATCKWQEACAGQRQAIIRRCGEFERELEDLWDQLDAAGDQ